MENDYDAYCLNQAVHYFGMDLEGQLASVEGNPTQTKRQRQAILDRVLLRGQPQPKQRFADPAGKF